MRIILATGIFPPEIGGPAQYAKNLKAALEAAGHDVRVAYYGAEKKLPTGIRHIYFFIKSLFLMMRADFCIALDTFSVGFPVVAASVILRKKVIIRTGGDFLWEQYVERTGKKVLLREFYVKEQNNFSLKERIIFSLTRWTLSRAFKVVFSTDWQMDIWKSPYGISPDKIEIIENYYGPKETPGSFGGKVFIAGTRNLKWKNSDILARAFKAAKEKNPDLILDAGSSPYEDFLEKIRKSYAVILVSLGDISPNLILDAVRLGKPFILTRETGLYGRLKDVGVFADPLDEGDIAKKILWLSEDGNYSAVKKRVENFSFSHTWEEIAGEFLNLYGNNSR